TKIQAFSRTNPAPRKVWRVRLGHPLSKQRRAPWRVAFHLYRREDQREFDRWLKANAIVALIMAVGMLAMALAGPNSSGRPDSAGTERAEYLEQRARQHKSCELG